MKLQQLRYIWEVAHHDLNVSATAQSLYTSQPGISKQIRLLEDELGVEVFSRSGKHLTRITPAGEAILKVAGDILSQVESIRKIAQEFCNEDKGDLYVATTHTQARYILPDIIQKFMAEYPNVSLHMEQGTPLRIADLASDGSVDFAIATEALEKHSDLIMMPCYKWHRTVVVPKNHELANRTELELEELSQYPIVTYGKGFTGRSRLDEAFAENDIKPNIVFTASDADVIKTYVRLGVGVGVIASMAYDEETDSDLVPIRTDNLFMPSVTNIGFRKGTFMRGYMYDFIRHFAPHLTKEIVDEAYYRHTHRLDVDELFADLDIPVY